MHASTSASARAANPGQPSPTTCPICCNDFNKTLRKNVECNYCLGNACRACVRQFLLSQTDPQCMHCRRPWMRDFLVTVLPATFINTELKAHRQNTLFDLERALLPGTMPVVRAYQHARTLATTNKELQSRLNELMLQVRGLSGTIHGNQVVIERIDRALNMERMIPEFAEDWNPENTRQATETQAVAFSSSIMCPCPAPHCRGFVKSVEVGVPKCGVCVACVCKTCHEWIQEEGGTHACKPDNIKSAEAIRKSTRPCPQCAVPIFRISGCSQMFCVSCKTAFDWNTGNVLNKRNIHNPHYYEWVQSQRGNGGGNQGQNLAELCDAPVDVETLNDWLRSALPLGTFLRNIDRFEHRLTPNVQTDARPQYEDTNTIIQLHRILSHIEDVEIELLRPRARPGEHNNMHLRTQYLNNQIDEEEFKRQIVTKEIARTKNHGIMQVYEMMVEAGRDIYRNNIRRGPRTVEQARILLAELMELVRYGNECFVGISRNYNSTSVPCITRVDNGRWSYRIKTQRAKGTVAAEVVA